MLHSTIRGGARSLKIARSHGFAREGRCVLGSGSRAVGVALASGGLVTLVSTWSSCKVHP